jgi:hypothetical protein
LRRATTVALAIMLCSAFLVASGCGGDTARAQQYMKTADSYYDQVATDSQALSGKITSAFSGATDPAQMQAAVAQLNGFLDSMDKEADKAGAAYEKMTPLKGVGDYTRYASMQIKLMGLVKQATGKLRTVMNQVAAAVGAGDTAKLQALQASFEADFNQISQQITTLEQQANKFKSQKNL